MKTAVIDVPHMEGERSCKLMLETAGYEVYSVGKEVCSLLSYMPVRSSSRIEQKAGRDVFNKCDLFVLIKHFAVQETIKRFPRLEDKILWFCINAGVPGVVTSHAPYKMNPLKVPVPFVGSVKWYEDESSLEVSGPRYPSYLPLADKNSYVLRNKTTYADPICLIHNAKGWGGYGWITDHLTQLGVKIHGKGSPHGVLSTPQVKQHLSLSLCYVHLKSQDCPGYSLYEAMLTGCPVILPSQFLDLTNYHDLYEHGETCLVIEDPMGDKTPERASVLINGVREAVDRLQDPAENQRIGRNGRERLLQLMWNVERDGLGFNHFMKRNFGG